MAAKGLDMQSQGGDSNLPPLACSDWHTSLGMWRLQAAACMQQCMTSPAPAQPATRRAPLLPQHSRQRFHFSGSGCPDPAAEALSSVAWSIGTVPRPLAVARRRCAMQLLAELAAAEDKAAICAAWVSQQSSRRSDQRRGMPFQHSHMVTMPLHQCDLAEGHLRCRQHMRMSDQWIW